MVAVCANGQKLMHLHSIGGIYHRRYTQPPDTTTTNLPVRAFQESLSEIVAIGPQLEAYKGHRWPLFSRRGGG